MSRQSRMKRKTQALLSAGHHQSHLLRPRQKYVLQHKSCYFYAYLYTCGSPWLQHPPQILFFFLDHLFAINSYSFPWNKVQTENAPKISDWAKWSFSGSPRLPTDLIHLQHYVEGKNHVLFYSELLRYKHYSQHHSRFSVKKC